MITLSALPISIFLIAYWLLSRKPKNTTYFGYAYFTCRHCKKRTDVNHEFCPRCKKDDSGMTIQERMLFETRQELKDIRAEQQDMKEKFNLLGEFMTTFKSRYK